MAEAPPEAGSEFPHHKQPPLISPLADSFSFCARAAFGGCAPTRAYGHSLVENLDFPDIGPAMRDFFRF